MSATKELERFWHWFDNEKPAVDVAMRRGDGNLGEVAQEAMAHAAALVSERARPPTAHEDEDEQIEFGLEQHPAALRELSLSLCAALERMREMVPEAPKADPVLEWTGKLQVYWDEVASFPDRLLVAGRQSGKSARIEQMMRQMLESGKIAMWHT